MFGVHNFLHIVLYTVIEFVLFIFYPLVIFVLIYFYYSPSCTKSVYFAERASGNSPLLYFISSFLLFLNLSPSPPSANFASPSSLNPCYSTLLITSALFFRPLTTLLYPLILLLPLSSTPLYTSHSFVRSRRRLAQDLFSMQNLPQGIQDTTNNQKQQTKTIIILT